MNFLDAAGDKSQLALRIAEAVERGELVAILADRVMGDRTTSASFLGGSVALPAGPYLLAAALKCPVLLVTAAYSAPNTYSLRCEPLAEQVVLPRAGRDEALREYAQKYADWLERLCRETPDNWFNFYDFWEHP
jgi:predicted LPLAT superfamily acyltransferase